MTSSFDVQICSVSDQPDPNFFSVHEEQYRPKKLYLLVTPKMQEKAKWLKNAVSFVDEIVTIDVPSENDPVEIRRLYEEIFKEELQHTDKLLVNINGGTKLMAITASRVCEKLGIEYVYVTLDQPAFLFFTSLDISPKRVELNPNLEGEWAQRYLAAHNVIFDKKGESLKFWEKAMPKQKAFFDLALANNKMGEPKYRNAVGRMNGLISKYKSLKDGETLEYPKFNNSKNVHPDQFYHKLLNKIKLLEMVREEDGNIYFPDRDTLEFLHGRWLEQYTAIQLMELEMGIRPFNLVMRRSSPGQVELDNELDVVFFQRGKLHVIEVKTSKLKDPQQKDDQGIIYKLNDLCKTVGGLSCKKAIVSFFPPTPKMLGRAAEDGIRFIYGVDVTTRDKFRKSLKDWINSPS